MPPDVAGSATPTRIPTSPGVRVRAAMKFAGVTVAIMVAYVASAMIYPILAGPSNLSDLLGTVSAIPVAGILAPALLVQYYFFSPLFLVPLPG